VSSIVHRLKYLRPTFELREHFQYNNQVRTVPTLTQPRRQRLTSLFQMYMLGAHLIATYTNASFPSFVSSRILAPLNMSSSTYFPTIALKTGRFSESWTSFGRLIPRWFTTDAQAELIAGAGGLISTARDMASWLRLLLGAIEVEGIPRTVLEEVMKPAALPSVRGGSTTTYGMGWGQSTAAGHRVRALLSRPSIRAVIRLNPPCVANLA
jgi:CubicO group peptidase (beta-lactamase class C family)